METYSYKTKQQQPLKTTASLQSSNPRSQQTRSLLIKSDLVGEIPGGNVSSPFADTKIVSPAFAVCKDLHSSMKIHLPQPRHLQLTPSFYAPMTDRPYLHQKQTVAPEAKTPKIMGRMFIFSM